MSKALGESNNTKPTVAALTDTSNAYTHLQSS